jgi:hypothetical protein
MSLAASICAIWIVGMFITLSVIGIVVGIIDWTVAMYNRPSNQKDK